MADIDNLNLSRGPRKVNVGHAQIALMLAQETSAFSNPREGGNSTEGFMGPPNTSRDIPPKVVPTVPNRYLVTHP